MNIIDIINKTRHEKEKKYRTIAFVLTGLTVLTFLLNTSLLNNVSQYFGYYGIIFQVISNFLGASSIISFVIMILATFIFQYCQFVGSAVKVTEKNFPEIYTQLLNYCAVLNMKKVPEVYIMQNNGVLNALSSWIMGRHYIVLYSDLVDVAYLENKDMDAVNFVLAHELAHIYFQHTDLWYILATYGGRVLPIFSQAFYRTMEYSCDRAAQALTDSKGAFETMFILTSGRHLYKYVDIQDYLDNCTTYTEWYEKLGIFFVNLLSTHPIMPYRVKALADPERKSGRLY